MLHNPSVNPQELFPVYTHQKCEVQLYPKSVKQPLLVLTTWSRSDVNKFILPVSLFLEFYISFTINSRA